MEVLWMANANDENKTDTRWHDQGQKLLGPTIGLLKIFVFLETTVMQSRKCNIIIGIVPTCSHKQCTTVSMLTQIIN